MINAIRLIFLLILLFSCGKDEKVNKNDIGKIEELDILTNTEIIIRKENQTIIKAKAERIEKDKRNTYFLKASKDSDRSTLPEQLRTELTIISSYESIKNKQNNYSDIKKKAEELHSKGGNIKAEIYNKENTNTSILYANEAHITNGRREMIAEGNVVIYSDSTNFMLVGEKIIWDNQNNKIKSDDPVVLIKKGHSECNQQSQSGFRSNMDLSEATFKDVKGIIGKGGCN